MIQMRIPVDLEKIVDVTDEIYTFSEVMDRIELRKYYSDKKVSWADRDMTRKN